MSHIAAFTRGLLAFSTWFWLPAGLFLLQDWFLRHVVGIVPQGLPTALTWSIVLVWLPYFVVITPLTYYIMRGMMKKFSRTDLRWPYIVYGLVLSFFLGFFGVCHINSAGADKIILANATLLSKRDYSVRPVGSRRKAMKYRYELVVERGEDQLYFDFETNDPDFYEAVDSGETIQLEYGMGALGAPVVHGMKTLDGKAAYIRRSGDAGIS